MKDVIVTVVIAVVLALLFMYVLLGLAFSGWGDHFPPGSPSPASSSLQGETLGRQRLTPSGRRVTSLVACPDRDESAAGDPRGW